MRKVFKFIGILVLVVVVVALGGIVYITMFLPRVNKAPEIKVAMTPENIERGKYLANHVAVCIDCHSKRDWSQYAGPLVPGTEGQGGEQFDQKMGFPGVFHARNITPYGISKWTDGEIFRAVTVGVDKDGNALFPVMPYHHYGMADSADICAIVSYVRTLPSIKNEVELPKPDFPMNIILHTIPQDASLKAKPSPSDSVAYGAYLVNMSGCVECHTQVDKGQIIAGMEFGGGREFKMPCGIIRTPNITPHQTGIASWTREQFINRFKSYTTPGYKNAKLTDKDFQTVMPWLMYSGMTESDLSSIYQYLRTVKPIANTVNKFSPAS